MAPISGFNVLTSFSILMILLPSQLETFYITDTGCHHNGTWYADKSLVPTTEKCLNCECNKKTLVCRLKVCPEMPMPPPRGCVVVQKKNTCCPYLSCARLDAFYKIPATRRIIAYLDHYERESIDRVVNENMLQRRSDDTDVDLYVCVKNGTVYKSGSAMSSSNLCSYCYCIGGTEKCVKPKCMLPVEGCKPIFVDSTCCPVRYDCSTKQTGKSSQEVRYRKVSNKHYMRMSQRLQRNHGCTVGQHFYTEGQKMKSDKDKPCDICFCIRGQRKCAPKKCAPALRNCIPVVPKGQCCPSSYDCGSQRDYRRSQNSRQFNLFSLLFGKDEDNDENTTAEIAVQYPHDRDPIKHKQATTEKSLYDTIREGLEFIDSNNNQVLKDNTDLVDMPSQQVEFKQTRPSPTPIPLGMHNIVPSTSEISFLDLLLGSSEPNEQIGESVSEEIESNEEKTTPTNQDQDWVDLLLGPEENHFKNSSTTTAEKTDLMSEQTRMELESTTSIDRTDVDSLTESGEYSGELNAEQQDYVMVSTTDITSTTEAAMTEETIPTFTTALVMETTAKNEHIKKPINLEILRTTKAPTTTSAATTTATESTLSSTTAKPPLSTPTTAQKTTKTSIQFQKTKPIPDKPVATLDKINTQPKPETTSDFLAQLLDGLSDILGKENKTRQHATFIKVNLNKTLPSQIPTPKPMPMFKPLPLEKTYTRINSKIANLTVEPTFVSTRVITKPTFKPLPPNGTVTHPSVLLEEAKEEFKTTTSVVPTPKMTSTTVSSKSSSFTRPPNTTTIFSTLKPLVVKTNPTILESEPLDQNTQPTLPPSLPNLKIIPFLPTDAVKADHKSPSSYNFLHHSSAPISRIDYDLYDDANLYPSITEKYPLYPDLEDGSKAEYIYKFNVEGPDSLVSSNAGKFDGTLGSPAFLKYDFADTATPSSTKGFSPPIKTEGGFVPKEPLIVDDAHEDHQDNHDNISVQMGDSYHVTQHIIDITTSATIFNTTKVIEITTPDPFKDVIRTEPPPDLTSLIEDKLKNLISQSNTTTSSTATNSTASSGINAKPQNTKTTEINLRPADAIPMNLKTKTQIKKTYTFSGNSNGTNKPLAAVKTENNVQHRINQLFGDGMNDEGNTDAHYGSTIPPFKSLPTAQQFVQGYSASTATKEPAKLKQTQTTMRPMDSATRMATTKITTMTTKVKRPTSIATVKINRNKTISANTTATKTQTQTRPSHEQHEQQKPMKINKNPSLIGNEIKVLASPPKSPATKTKTSSTFSSSPSSEGSVSTLKIKSNTTRRITSTKPTKHHKPSGNPVTATATSTTPTTTINNTPKTNVINIDRVAVDTRRTQQPTTNGNILALEKLKTSTAISASKTTTAKATTAIRTTTSGPSSTSSILPQNVPSANPFFMSPFDKLPFMDASFEVKRNSTTPSTTGTTTTSVVTASTPQRFEVAATIATDALQEQHSKSDADDSFTSSRHKLMDLMHYKHTLNQLEGLEPSTQYRPQLFASSSSSTTTQFNSRLSSPTSMATQQQPSSSSSPNNLIDPTGILKLAGCNIYGRMYRVGRIILELSSPCLECKCTEIGVKCGPLEC